MDLLRHFLRLWKQIYAFSLNSSEYYILYVSESSLCGL
jgi:hypothetical protein